MPKLGFMATPESFDALMEYIEQMNGDEKALAIQIAFMTSNLANKIVEEKL